MNQNNFTQPKIDHQSILFVSDLPSDIIEEDLKNFFANYHYDSAKIFRHKNTYAHVYLDNPDYARKDLNGEILQTKSGSAKPVRICKYEIKTQFAENIKDSSKSLIVKNLASDITSKDFYKMFAEFGEILSSKLEVDNRGVSREYGFVHFSDAKSAEAAKQKLNGIEIKGRKLEVNNLIPLAVKDKASNIYVKNIPRDFSDTDLLEMFSKYGEITSAVVSKDENGFSRGFGYINFRNNIDAIKAINDLKEKNLSFPGLPPLYVNILMKKEERESINKRNFQFESPKFMARIIYDPNINSNEEFEKELRLFIKVILLQEYSPRNIETNFNGKYAVVTMNSNRDMENFFKKYAEHCQQNYPRFYIEPYLELKPEMTVNPYLGGNPYMENMMNKFTNMSLNPPNQPQFIGNFRQMPQMGRYPPQMNVPNPQFKPLVHFGKPQRYQNNPNYRQVRNKTYNQRDQQNFNENTFNQAINTLPSQTPTNDSNLMEDVASLIYDEVEIRHSEDAGKITGMIVDLGLEEMRKLLTNRDKLNQVIDEAFEMLHKN